MSGLTLRHGIAFGVVVALALVLGGSALLLGADHGHHGGGCPLMVGQVGPCLMDYREHVAAWERISSGAPATIWLFVVSIVALGAAPFLRFLVLQHHPAAPAYAASPYAVLLARGIMHGKNP
jgi:hypothetical protein